MEKICKQSMNHKDLKHEPEIDKFGNENHEEKEIFSVYGHCKVCGFWFNIKNGDILEESF